MLTLLVTTALAIQVWRPHPDEPLGIWSVAVLDCEDACVVIPYDMSLRRVDLASGFTTAIAGEHMDGCGDRIRIQVLDEGRVATWQDRGPLFVRDARTLTPIHRFDPPSHPRIACVDPRGDWIATVSADQRLTVYSTRPGGPPLEIPGELGEPRWAGELPTAFSPSGTLLAVGKDEALDVLDASSGGVLAEFSMPDLATDSTRSERPRKLDPWGSIEVNDVVFPDDDRILIQWHILDDDGEEGSDSVVVLQWREGSVLARIDPDMVPVSFVHFLGGPRFLRVDSGLSAITCSFGYEGFVASYGDSDWKERWRLEFEADHAYDLAVRHSPGSRRMYVSSRFDDFARVVDAYSGQNLAGDKPLGYELGGTADDRFVVFVRDFALNVLDGQTFELLYRRGELSDGRAAIQRDDERQVIDLLDAYAESGEPGSQSSASSTKDN